MKQIKIEIRLNDEDDKIATALETSGYNKNKISDQFEVLGILENLVDIQKDKIKKLIHISK